MLYRVVLYTRVYFNTVMQCEFCSSNIIYLYLSMYFGSLNPTLLAQFSGTKRELEEILLEQDFESSRPIHRQNCSFHAYNTSIKLI